MNFYINLEKDSERLLSRSFLKKLPSSQGSILRGTKLLLRDLDSEL